MSRDGIIICPQEQSFSVGFEGPPELTRTESLEKARVVKAFYQYLHSFADQPFVIKEIGKKVGNIIPVVIEINGKSKTFNIDVFDLENELDLKNLSHLTFSTPSTFPTDTKKAILHRSFRDGFTLAATSYFELKNKKVSEVSRDWNFFSPQSRLAVDGDKIVLTKRGLSRFEQLFHRFFNSDTFEEYMRQNAETIDAYKAFLITEAGEEKVSLIERTFGFSLDDMKTEGHPLLPAHVHYFNTGINHVEMRDVEAFEEKIKRLGERYDEEEHKDMLALDFFAEGDHNLTMREMRGMLAFSETPQAVTLGEIRQRYEAAFFNRCVDAVMTPRSDWEGAYTGRMFNAPIKGSYNKDVDDKSKLRYEVDMQEMAQVHHEILDANSSDKTRNLRIFNEYLAKIAAKKHPVISTADGSEWRVGGIIPSPFRDNGETVWYRVDQAVDSAHGKLWYVFKPAHVETTGDFPVFRVMRDTCRQKYALRAGPTIPRDLATHAGYKYSSTTELEDREFFDQYTLPVWMGYLFVGVKSNNFEERIQALKAATNEYMEEITRRFQNLNMIPEEKEDYKRKLEAFIEKKNAFFSNPNEETIENFIDLLKRQAPSQDQRLFQNLLKGITPPRIVCAGNSLGGFDAQFDVVKHTAYRHRLPITALSVYSHSTLKVHEDDDKAFTQFFQKHKDVMVAMGGKLEFDHITEEGDIVSMFGRDRTFLGKGLKDDFDFEFRVFRPLETSESPQITKLGTHIRRVEGLTVGTDIEWTEVSVEDYEELCSQKRIAKAALDTWHRIGNKLGLFSAMDSIWRSGRYLGRGNRFISWEDRNKKLIVKHQERHRFSPIIPNHLKVERRKPQRADSDWLYKHFGLLNPVV